MYDVIYFNAWSDIICTAAKLLHGSSAGNRDSADLCCNSARVRPFHRLSFFFSCEMKV